MIKKEINEIKGLYDITECSIRKLAACYVDGEKNKVTTFTETFLNLKEEEQHKYLDIFKKTLSGTIGKNLFDMHFTNDAYIEGSSRELLIKLRDSGLEDEEALDEFYSRIIDSYDYVGNYLIILIQQAYDVPGVSSDGIEMDDASEEVFDYILCSICPVTLSKPGLAYDALDSNFHELEQAHMVDPTDTGFLFPAFNERSADEENILIYSKNANQLQDGVLSTLACEIPVPAKEQKATFQNIVTETLGDECNYDTIKNIHDNLNDYIDERKKDPEPALIDKDTAKKIMEKSGVSEEKLAGFEEKFEEATGGPGKTMLAANVCETRKFEVKTPDVVVKVNPDKTDLIETMLIEGKPCLVIHIDENLEVNGISVNPDTGEVFEN